MRVFLRGGCGARPSFHPQGLPGSTKNKFLAAAFNFKLLTTSLSVSPFLCQKFGSIRADVIEQMRFKQRLRVIQTIEDTTKRNVVRIH